jgi:hypothetical protein
MQLIPEVKGARGDQTKVPVCDFRVSDFQDPATPPMLVIRNAPLGARVAVFVDPPQGDGSNTLYIGVIEKDIVTFLADPAAYEDGEFMLRIRGKSLQPFELQFKLTPQKQALMVTYMAVSDWVVDADLVYYNEVTYNTGAKLDDYAVLAEFIIKEREIH